MLFCDVAAGEEVEEEKDEEDEKESSSLSFSSSSSFHLSCTIFSVPRAWILKPAIVLFCLFHMTAVASYSISANWQITPLTYMREHTLPFIRGYLMATSQWQQWNLFSPDPLRRVSRYRVVWQENEVDASSSWLDEGFPYHRKANITKTLRRLEEQPGSPILLQFLALACRERSLPQGTNVSLERSYYILPFPTKPLRIAEWRNFQPEWTMDSLAERPCP